MKDFPKLPRLMSDATEDTAALTCYALVWRERALIAEMQRDGVMAALESAAEFCRNRGGSWADFQATISAAIAIAKGTE